MAESYHLRLARQDDLRHLNQIEEEASTLFQDTPFALEVDQEPLSIELLRRQQAQNLIWVAANSQDRPVGFAVAIIMGTRAHLHELSVEPEHTRRGLGTQLTRQVIEFAKESGMTAVTLSTFRNIEWNAPFYQKLGFRELTSTEYDHPIQSIRQAETNAGLPIAERIIMILNLD